MGGQEQLIIELDLEDVVFNTSESLMLEQPLSITNLNGDTNMTLMMNTTYEALDPECPDGENDIEFVFMNQFPIVKNMETFILEEGLNNLRVQARAENAQSCPANIAVQIQLIPTEI